MQRLILVWNQKLEPNAACSLIIFDRKRMIIWHGFRSREELINYTEIYRTQIKDSHAIKNGVEFSWLVADEIEQAMTNHCELPGNVIIEYFLGDNDIPNRSPKLRVVS